MTRLQPDNERDTDVNERLAGQIRAYKEYIDRLNANHRHLKSQYEVMPNKFAASVGYRPENASGSGAQHPSAPLPRVGNLRPEQVKPLYEHAGEMGIARNSSASPAQANAGDEATSTGERAGGGNPALVAREGRANPHKDEI